MNYLAHVYLSGDHPQVALGNFIADHIKGKDYLNFPTSVQHGILLHRAIDTYTDAHPNFKRAAHLFFPTHRHYSRVLVDMYFDHLLARDWKHFHSSSLAIFASDFYEVLASHLHLLPASFEKISRIIREQDWFQCYATLTGMEHILTHMDRRTRFDAQLRASIPVFKTLQNDFEPLFLPFFRDLEAFVAQERIRIQNELQ